MYENINFILVWNPTKSKNMSSKTELDEQLDKLGLPTRMVVIFPSLVLQLKKKKKNRTYSVLDMILKYVSNEKKFINLSIQKLSLFVQINLVKAKFVL